MAKTMTSFRLLRILGLLTVLVLVGLNRWQTSAATARWDMSQWVVVYPVNGDGLSTTSAYIEGLRVGQFAPVAEYLNSQAYNHGVSLATPFTVDLAPQVTAIPPEIPLERSVLSVVWYSLRLRYFGLTNNPYDGPSPDIKIYVLYFSPFPGTVLPHSVGLQNGKIGVVNGFASWKHTRLTNIILTHEILHTVGASDKYDVVLNQPHFPQGYADPEQVPLYPQYRAEIMGATIMLSEDKPRLPISLGETTVGDVTAREINWGVVE
ncbi:MAG: hypothetical protein PF495_11850 [Spirochaetales bacterium]|jgi:hypothetical protein|nr:hypothetical protein [Spirochaetales bacterium]